MNKYKFKFLFLLIAISENSFLMGNSKRFEDFMREIKKSKPNQETLSELYYDITDEDEQKRALEQATIKNIEITGQEDKQQEIKLKNIVTKRTPLQEFEKLIEIGAKTSEIEKSLKSVPAENLDDALKIATENGIIFEDYKERQRKFKDVTKVEEVQVNIVKKEAELSKIISENRDLKEKLNDILTLSEQVQDIKENIKSVEKQISENNGQINKLKSTTEVKSSQLSNLAKSQNKQLKIQNESLKDQVAKLQEKIEKLQSKK